MESCQSQRKLSDDRVWCDAEAPFEYFSPQYSPNVPRIRIPLCVEHARDLYVSLEMAFWEGIVTLNVIGANPKLKSVCKTCGNAARIERIGETFYAQPATYCPWCGSKNDPARPDFENDYWEVLSAEFSSMDHQLLKLLFAEWNDRKQFPRFRDFVAYVLRRGGL